MALKASELKVGDTHEEVVVDNLTDVPLSLRLSGAANLKLEVPAHHQRSIRMKPGSYAYQATALLAPPAGGSARFLEDHRYRWTFAIVRMPSDDPALAGTGFHCFDPEHELPFKSCYRAKEVCEQRARGFFAAASRASCERSSSSYLYSFRYAGADETHRDFAATRAECEDRRAERLKFALVDRAISVLSIIVIGSIAYAVSDKRRGGAQLGTFVESPSA